MTREYRVPALERANEVLELLASEPFKLKLIDLSKRLGIHKSSMFLLLKTMETLLWVERDQNDRYAIGWRIGSLGSMYFRSHNLIADFQKESAATVARLGETLQLAKREGTEVLYLAKVSAPTPVQLVSEPGMRYPAHATGLGKALLAELEDEDVIRLYGTEAELPALTPYTIVSLDGLLAELAVIRSTGLSLDNQESVVGFFCAAAIVRSADGQLAAVSCSMPAHAWSAKQEAAKAEILDLAGRLSGLRRE